MSEKVVFGSGSEDFRQAEWLSRKLEGKWRYDHTSRQWHQWTGIRWAPDRTQQVRNAVSRIAAAHLNGDDKAGIKRVEEEIERKALLRLFNLASIDKALEALSTFPGYGTDGEDWDQNPFLMGCENGILDLRTNALVENPTPDMLVTKTTKCAFKPVTSPDEFYRVAPVFMDFMLDVTSSDGVSEPDMVSFLLLWFGASLFGFSPEQRFLLMTGIGRNGKGAMKHAIMSATGEYGAQPDANIYMRTKFGAARSDAARADLMDLKGRRVTFFSEPEGNKFAEEALKAHTGGDTITARALYSNRMVSWEPTHSITFLVNNAPEVEDLGPSMASRVMVADFRNRYDGDKEDKKLYGKLDHEASGILAILAYSAKVWYESWENGRGLELPKRVIEQSAAFMARGDQLAQFLNACTVTGPDEQARSRAVYEAYMEWCAKNPEVGEAVSEVRFSQGMQRKGYRKHKTNTSNVFKGLRLLRTDELADRDGLD